MATIIPFPSRAKAPPAPAALSPQGEELFRALRGQVRNRTTGEPASDEQVRAMAQRILEVARDLQAKAGRPS